jgi:hypothetical protein
LLHYAKYENSINFIRHIKHRKNYGLPTATFPSLNRWQTFDKKLLPMNNEKDKAGEKLKKILPYTRGIQRDLLEGENLLLHNELTRKTLKKLKWDNIINIVYLIIGGFISFFFTNILGSDTQKETIKELHNLQIERNALRIDFEKRLNEQNTLILDLKRKVNSLKN